MPLAIHIALKQFCVQQGLPPSNVGLQTPVHSSARLAQQAVLQPSLDNLQLLLLLAEALDRIFCTHA